MRASWDVRAPWHDRTSNFHRTTQKPSCTETARSKAASPTTTVAAGGLPETLATSPWARRRRTMPWRSITTKMTSCSEYRRRCTRTRVTHHTTRTSHVTQTHRRRRHKLIDNQPELKVRYRMWWRYKKVAIPRWRGTILPYDVYQQCKGYIRRTHSVPLSTDVIASIRALIGHHKWISDSGDAVLFIYGFQKGTVVPTSQAFYELPFFVKMKMFDIVERWIRCNLSIPNSRSMNFVRGNMVSYRVRYLKLIVKIMFTTARSTVQY